MLLLGSIRSIMIICIRIDNIFFRKPTRPSLPLRKAPPFSPSLSSIVFTTPSVPLIGDRNPQGREDVTALRCSEPLRYKVGGASKPSPDCAGWDRRGVSGDTSFVSCSSASGSSASTALDLVQRELMYLGLWKFARAVMYVLHEALGLSEEKMIAPMDEKRGKLLLAEILNGGNFGQHFVRFYPAEALSEPIFRTWHFFWRMKNKRS